MELFAIFFKIFFILIEPFMHHPERASMIGILFLLFSFLDKIKKKYLRISLFIVACLWFLFALNEMHEAKLFREGSADMRFDLLITSPIIIIISALVIALVVRNVNK